MSLSVRRGSSVALAIAEDVIAIHRGGNRAGEADLPAHMAQAIRDGKLGRVAAAHASYGHGGPSWSSFFYEKDGGSLYDLGVYSITTLTGLLGPAKAVIAISEAPCVTLRPDPSDSSLPV